MRISLFILTITIAACSPKDSPVNQVKGNSDSIAQPSTSTLVTPANYIRTTLNTIEQAKKSAKLMEETQNERLKSALGQ